MGLFHVKREPVCCRHHRTLVLVLFWATLLPLYGIWLAQDQVVSPWDMAGHAEMSYDLWHQLTHGRLFEVYRLSSYYPPLFHLVAAPLTLLSSNPDIYCVANWIMLLVTMVFTMKVGARLSGVDAGLAAGLLIPAYPYLGLMCRQPMLDLSLTAMVMATLYLIVRSRPLRDPRQAHAFGLVITLGLLAKWPYLFFATLPLLIYLAVETVGAYQKKILKIHCRNLLITGLWPVLVAGPWYVRAVPHILHKAGRQLSAELAARRGLPAIYTLDNLTCYAKTLYEAYLPGSLLLLVLIGSIVLIWEGWRKRGDGQSLAGWGYLLATFISGYLIVTLIANKDPRYIMPLVPLLALVSTHWLERVGRRQAHYVVLILMILSWTTSYRGMFVHGKPERRDMGIEKVAEWIAEHHAEKKTKVMVLTDEWTLNAAAIHYALYRRNKDCSAQPLLSDLRARRLRKFQFLVIADPPGENSPGAPFQIANARKALHLAEWKICASIPRGDNRKILILGKTGEPHAPRAASLDPDILQRFRIGLGISEFEFLERGDDQLGHDQVAIPLFVGGDDVPGSPLRAGVAQGVFVGFHVFIPELALDGIGG